MSCKRRTDGLKEWMSIEVKTCCMGLLLNLILFRSWATGVDATVGLLVSAFSVGIVVVCVKHLCKPLDPKGPGYGNYVRRMSPAPS